MTAAIHNFTEANAIEQGATFTNRFTYKDSTGVAINLTSYTARMQIRASVKAATTLAELTTANGGIVLGGAAGTIDLLLTATQTAAITAKRGVYDLELIDVSGVVLRLVEGAVEFSPEVTR